MLVRWRALGFCSFALAVAGHTTAWGVAKNSTLHESLAGGAFEDTERSDYRTSTQAWAPNATATSLVHQRAFQLLRMRYDPQPVATRLHICRAVFCLFVCVLMTNRNLFHRLRANFGI